MNPNEEEGEEISPSSPSFRIGSPTTISAASVVDQIHLCSSADDDTDGDAFEFPALGDAARTAGEIFDNGRIRPAYPVFDRSLLNDAVGVDDHRRGSLRKLFLLERESRGTDDSSSSSSEADELEGVPEGTYCVWTPKAKESAERCKKSGSTGSTSSLRVKLRDLVIGRSNSDGKEKFLFVSNNGKGKRAGSRGTNRKTTFLPYKQDLVGFFSSVNSISRSHHPF